MYMKQPVFDFSPRRLLGSHKTVGGTTASSPIDMLPQFQVAISVAKSFTKKQRSQITFILYIFIRMCVFL